jgi:hypothetical protein
VKFILILFLLVCDAHATCRSSVPKHQFEKQQGYPHGRKGFVVDHICALECGGLDAPINMQYQTYKDGKAKDRWERTQEGCKRMCSPENSTYPERRVFNCR